MNKSIILTLTDKELIELERIILNDDSEAALTFLKTHVGDKARGSLGKRGHCKPSFELPGSSPIPEEFRKKA